MNKKIHTPEGLRDIFARECDKKRYLERQIEKLYRSYGYQSIETPSLEFFEVFASEVGTTPSRDLYKFFDRDGNTLVLRPDFTPSVARAVSMYFEEEQMPLRLCYHGNVFRNSSSLKGLMRETTQMGVEFLNEDSAEADAEVIALVVSTMRRAGLSQFQVTLSHVDYFNAVAAEAQLDEDVIAELRELLITQNRFGAQELVDRLQLRSDLKKVFTEMFTLFGDDVILDQAEKLTNNRTARAAISRLRRIYEILELYGCRDYVTFDLAMISEYHYYTGIIFQAFTYGSGDALIKGGRYNSLIAHFGKEAAAVGFAAQIDSLLNALERQHVELPVGDIKTMVLYPSYLEKKAMDFAMRQREKGLDVALVRFESGKVLDSYRAYGMRNQFGGIIYFQSAEDVFAINLLSGAVNKITI